MFENLSEKLERSFKILKGEGKITEINVAETLKDVRRALLDADVNYKVAKTFTDTVKQKALGMNVLTAIKPGELMVKIVHDELKKVLGDETSEVIFKNNGTTVIMTCGLQGAGKTTAIGKMALHYRKTRKAKPCLIAADVYRPAAIDQLVTIGKQIQVPVFEMGIKTPVAKIVKEGLKYAQDNGYDLVIIDTAGRLHINEELMDELKEVKKINVSVVEALIFFSCVEIFIKVKIIRSESHRKLKSREPKSMI